MLRLVWLCPERVEPEESYPALSGKRPAPEPIAFSQATPELLQRRVADVVLVDGRRRPDEAAELIRKLKPEVDGEFLVVLGDEAILSFDWACGVADFLSEHSTKAELEARISRVAHPEEPDPDDIIRRGDITINRERFEVKTAGSVLDLTFKEFELIAYLAARPGKVCSRNTLLSEVWGYDFFGGTRTVDVHVRRLRAKLGPAAHMIETVRNVGYRFAG